MSTVSSHESYPQGAPPTVPEPTFASRHPAHGGKYTPDLDREFGASWVLLGATRRVSVRPLEALRWIVNRGPLEAFLGTSCKTQTRDLPYAHGGLLGSLLGAFWEHFGSLWGPLGTFLGVILGFFWAVWGPSWAVPGPSWTVSGGLGRLVAVLGPSWAVEGASCGPLGAP